MNTPEPTTASAPAVDQRAGVSILNVLIVAIACSAISGYTAWRLASARPASQVVVIDTEKITRAQIDHTLSKPGITQEEAAAAGRQFVQALNAELTRYSEGGIVVLNASVALNRPAGVDVTREIAASLGVEIK